MHGFFGSYKTKVTWDLSGFDDRSFVKRTHSEGDFQLTQVTLPKFLNDKCFAEIDGCFLATEGVLFEADKPEEAIARYRNGETTFWNSWRGSFAGVLYDSKTDTLLVFNDHIGSKMLFYAQTKDGFVFASDSYILARVLGLKPTNENFLWQLLLYGYSPIGETAFEGVHRLVAGEYLTIRERHLEQHTYYRFNNTPNHLSMDQNIECIDAAFRKAVERAIRKNEEYGYSHFLPLSAGLDSRMTNRIAHDLAKTPIYNITYSQTGFFDETAPRELAEYWHNTFLFTPLDNGDCLKLLDTITCMTCGMEHYSGAAETLWGLPNIAKQKAGLFLTGMVGDIIIGTGYTKCRTNQPYHLGEGALLPYIPSKLQDSLPRNFEQLYQNREIYYLYVRGFNCANLGSPLIHQTYGESFSPFCDVDLIEAAYSAPVQQRWGHKLYDQWILRKYPDMARWKHNGIYTIGQRPRIISIFGRAIAMSDIPKRMAWYILKHLHIHNYYTETKGGSMNPEDTWFKENKSLFEWSENYIQSNLSLLNAFPELQLMVTSLSKGTAMERMQVLTLLACLRQAR